MTSNSYHSAEYPPPRPTTQHDWMACFGNRLLWCVYLGSLITGIHQRRTPGKYVHVKHSRIPLRPSNNPLVQLSQHVSCGKLPVFIHHLEKQKPFTLGLLAGALIWSSWASSLGADSLRYHHWISKENGETPTARKAHGISMSSPSPTLTSLGTSVNEA